MGLRWAGPKNIGLCPAPQREKDEKQYVEDAMTNKKMDVITTRKRKCNTMNKTSQPERRYDYLTSGRELVGQTLMGLPFSCFHSFKFKRCINKLQPGKCTCERSYSCFVFPWDHQKGSGNNGYVSKLGPCSWSCIRVVPHKTRIASVPISMKILDNIATTSP